MWWKYTPKWWNFLALGCNFFLQKLESMGILLGKHAYKHIPRFLWGHCLYMKKHVVIHWLLDCIKSSPSICVPLCLCSSLFWGCHVLLTSHPIASWSNKYDSMHIFHNLCLLSFLEKEKPTLLAIYPGSIQSALISITLHGSGHHERVGKNKLKFKFVWPRNCKNRTGRWPGQICFGCTLLTLAAFSSCASWGGFFYRWVHLTRAKPDSKKPALRTRPDLSP